MTIKEISHKNCATTYEVNGVKVYCWAIVGGQLAISFDDYSFSTRYHYCEERDSNLHNWKEWDGVHVDQIGEQNLYNFVEKYVPLKILREQRKQLLGKMPKRSKRLHDEEEHRYFHAEFDIGWGYLGRVSLEAVREEDCCRGLEDGVFLPENWKKLADLVNNHRLVHLEDMTEEEFQTLVELVNQCG